MISKEQYLQKKEKKVKLANQTYHKKGDEWPLKLNLTLLRNWTLDESVAMICTPRHVVFGTLQKGQKMVLKTHPSCSHQIPSSFVQSLWSTKEQSVTITETLVGISDLDVSFRRDSKYFLDDQVTKQFRYEEPLLSGWPKGLLQSKQDICTLALVSVLLSDPNSILLVIMSWLFSFSRSITAAELINFLLFKAWELTLGGPPRSRVKPLEQENGLDAELPPLITNDVSGSVWTTHSRSMTSL